MAYYRVLLLEADGQIAQRVEFPAATDSAAEAAAEQLGGFRVKQLWRGAVWVKTWAPPLASRTGSANHRAA